jgi:transcriptional regulator with XRE-family HTH domain
MRQGCDTKKSKRRDIPNDHARETPMDGPSTLGEYLRAERERAGISQRQLAGRVGIHNSYLARLENGETANPAADLLQRIAEVLEISSADLLAFIGVKPNTTDLRGLVIARGFDLVFRGVWR